MNRTLLIINMGLLSFFFGTPAKADAPKAAVQSSQKAKIAPEDVGRRLRQMVLSTKPAEMGIKPSPEFPRVYAVIMDWPIDEKTATVFASSTGDASLYTTSEFGIVGGRGHASVRAAAAQFTHIADRLFEDSKPTSDYSYPTTGRVKFYLMTFDGVRVLETDAKSIENGTSKYAVFFAHGQNVLTELRHTVERKP